MGEPVEEPREAAVFLIQSATRLAVMRTLADGPRERQELKTTIEASRSSLSRALNALEDRGWIRRENGTYRLTRAGLLVVEQIITVLETIRVLQTLGEGIDYLPIEEMALDIWQFADARAITPTEQDPTRPYDYGIERVRAADRFSGIAYTAPPIYVRTFHEEVLSGEQDGSFVLAASYLDTLPADGELRAKWEELASGPATIRRHDDVPPYIVHVLDETVHIWLCGDDGETWGLLESENPTVRSWAEDMIADYLTEARPLETAPEA